MFDNCLSRRLDMLHHKLDEVRRWPPSPKKLRKLLLLRNQLRRLHRRMPV